VVVSGDQNAGQDEKINIGNKFFSKVWNSGNVWEQPQWIKFIFMFKLRPDWSERFLAIIQCGIVSSSVLLYKNMKFKISSASFQELCL
jgi:hypothetical protein